VVLWPMGSSPSSRQSMLGDCARGRLIHSAPERRRRFSTARSERNGDVQSRPRHTAGWEVHRNAVWRRGRVFLVCPSCSRRCTRLYVPVENRALACRSCWGLTYESRTLLNYKDSLYGRGALARMLGTSQREMAFITTSERRKERDRRSCERWEARSKLFKSLAASNETFQKTKR